MRHFLPFEWIAAIRFLREGAAQTTMIVIGVSVGVAVIVFMSALLAGLQANFLRRMFASQAQIVLLTPDEVARPLRRMAGVAVLPTVIKPNQRLRSIDQWQRIRKETEKRPDVLAVSPMVSGAAFAVRGDSSKGITLMGVDPSVFYKVVKIPEKIVTGTARLNSEDVLIGIQLASDLGVVVGDKIRVTASTGGNQTLSVAGTFDLGNKGANQRSAYVALRTAQALFNLVGGVTSIDVTLKDVYAAEDVAQTIAATAAVQADSWIKTNADFFSYVQSQNLSNIAIRFFVALSVAFGIASVLIVSVVQRSKEIGILRAMGASRGQIMRVFLVQGAVVGFLGAIVGSGLAQLLSWFWRTHALAADGTPSVATVIDLQLVALAAGLATVVGVCSALLPAIRAARLDPVLAIRG
jgi:lipoprotein-releasing system permease protein